MTRAAERSRVAVLGALPNEERYSFKAVQMLTEHGHTPVPVHLKGHEVLGITALKSLSDIDEPVDTLTMYVGPKTSSGELDRILKLKPRRVVFNRGRKTRNWQRSWKKPGLKWLKPAPWSCFGPSSSDLCRHRLGFRL